MQSRILWCYLVLACGAGVAQSAPLTLAEAQRLAVAGSPALKAQRAALSAAQSLREGAGELPDPKLVAGIDNLPLDGADRFNLTRDGMTMRRIGFMQEFERADKRLLRSEKADAEAQREAAVLEAARLNVRRDAALAWIERHIAERQLALLTELARESELATTTADAALAGGKGQGADPLAARLAAAQLADKLLDAKKNLARAEAALARWVGTATAKEALGAPPAFDALAHRHEDLTRDLETHPHLAMYAPMQAAAERDLRLADAARKPDWSLEVAFGQRGPAYANMLSIGVRIDLPIFQSRRQEPLVAARSAQLEQVRAQAEDARRAHAAEVEAMLAEWNAARERVARYRADWLPLAEERKAVALAAYRGGKGELAPVLEARKAEIETRMTQLMAEAEMARAWAQLNAMLPDPKDPS